MTAEADITMDRLITDELVGKSAAICGYDEILWKIRAGYASVLYGSVAVLSSLLEKDVLIFGKGILLSATILIVGFSLFGAGMDYSFMSSKLRVVEHRDRLIKISFDKARSGEWPNNMDDVLNSIINSGETKDKIDWDKTPGAQKVIIFIWRYLLSMYVRYKRTCTLGSNKRLKFDAQ